MEFTGCRRRDAWLTTTAAISRSDGAITGGGVVTLWGRYGGAKRGQGQIRHDRPSQEQQGSGMRAQGHVGVEIGGLKQ